MRSRCGGDKSVWSKSNSFTTDPECKKIWNIETSYTDDSGSIEISWFEDSDFSNWTQKEIKVVPAGRDEDLYNSVFTTDNPYVQAGLKKATNYDVYIRTDCTSENRGTSDWVKHSFDTQCVATDNFIQSFESSEYANCWNRLGSGIMEINTSPENSTVGNRSLRLRPRFSGGVYRSGVLYIVSPKIENLQNNAFNLSYDIKQHPSLDAQLQIGVLKDNNDLNSFFPIGEEHYIYAEHNLETNSEIINNVPNGNNYIAFKFDIPGYIPSASARYIFLDNVVLETNSTLNVNDFSKDSKKLIIHPNPVFDFVKIIDLTIKTVSIYSITGTQLLKVSKPNIDVSFLKKGIYIIDIVDNNNFHHYRKMIKN